MTSQDQDTQYAVEPGSPYRLVVFRGEAGSAVVGVMRNGSDETPDAGRRMHLLEARSIAAAEIATRDAALFDFYVEEVLRATLWPWHDNDPEEAAAQLRRTERVLATSLLQEDAFRAAVAFEHGTGTTCDIRLVRLCEATLPSVQAAVSEPGTLLKAAEAVEAGLVLGSPSVRASVNAWRVSLEASGMAPRP